MSLLSVVGRNAQRTKSRQERGIPQSEYIANVAAFVAIYITVNTRAICVADTTVRVNRCTQVIVAALINYWLRNNDHRNNPVIDNNTRRFPHCNLTPRSIDCLCLDQWLAAAHRSSDRSTAWPMTRDDT